jgi:hypothetical protein
MLLLLSELLPLWLLLALPLPFLVQPAQVVLLAVERGFA